MSRPIRTGRFASQSPVLLALHEGLSFYWWEQSPDRSDDSSYEAAVGTHLLEVSGEDGGRRGYMRISFSSRSLMDEVFSHPLEYMNSQHCLGADLSSDLATWRSAYRRLSTPPSLVGSEVSRRNLHAYVPSASDLASDLQHLDEVARGHQEAQLRWMSFPFVAYSSLDDDLRGRRLGRYMYVLAARHLGLSGRVLRASTNQSEYASRLWASLQRDPLVRTSEVEFCYPHHEDMVRVPSLDYRS